MKRRREIEVYSEIQSAIEDLSMIIKLKPADHTTNYAYIPTRPFLNVCNSILQILDKIGPTMSVLRQDIHQNIQRLEIDNEPNNTNHSTLSEILEEESNKGNARKGASCSKAILWLIRSLDFTVALLERLVIDKEQKMDEALEDSYNITLKQWHGWISYAAFKVALKLVPDNKTFISILMGKDANYEKLQEDMQSFILLSVPILEDCHSMLRLYKLDRLKSI
ncbi:hypothetical protein ACFE04_025574 [Oxalis oulophora]